MTVYSINELKSGLTVTVDGQLFSVLSCQHVKPGKGAAFARVRMKNLKAGTVLEKTFHDADKIEGAFIEQKKLTYSYQSEHLYHFMDENYEEVMLSEGQLGDSAHFLKDNLELTGYFYDKELVNIELPNFINFKIVSTEPGIKGDRSKSGMKPAKIETGYTIQVPLFIEEGTKIKVDTRTGEYIERV
jgi:elongation factor P